MSIPISSVVAISVTLTGTKFPLASFGIGAILSTSVGFTERTIAVTSASELTDYGYGTASDEYLAAQLYFGQSVKPQYLKILRRQVDNVVVSVTTVDDETTYTTTINGTEYVFVSDTDATAEEIAAGLVAAINLGSEPVTATDNLDGTYDLDADVAGTAFSVSVDAGQTVGTLSPAGTVADDLDEIEDYDSGWYRLIQIKPSSSDAVAAAAWIMSANLKTHSVWDDSATTYDAAEIGGLFAANNYQRSVVEYHSTSNLSAAHAGYYLPQTPGAASYQYNELYGIAADEITTSKRALLTAANIATLQELATRTVTIGSEFADGTPVFVIHGADKFVYYLQQRIVQAMIDLPKFPMTVEGRARLVSMIEQQLKEGIDDGFIRPNPDNPNQALSLDPITGEAVNPVYVPHPDDIATADKANGIWSGITISFNYAQETTRVEISANLQV
jgi:hypothetical protein